MTFYEKKITLPAAAILLAASCSALEFSLTAWPTVQLTQPADGSPTYMPHPHFRWTPNASADRYEIQIARDGSFQTLEDSDSIPVPRYVPLDGLPPGIHWWRVRPLLAGGQAGLWSDARKITIDEPLNVYNVSTNDPISVITNKIAAAAANTPSRLVFETGTYVFNLPDETRLFDLKNVTAMQIEGSRCEVVMQNPNSRFAFFRDCEDILLRQFNIVFEASGGEPVTHTAGTVISVTNASFVFQPLENYLPPTDPRISNASQRRWGCLMNPGIPGRLKYDAPDFFDLSDTIDDLGNGQYRLYLTEAQAGRIVYFEAGNLFVKNAGWQGGQILTAVSCLNVTYESVTNFGSPSAFFGGNNNDGTHFLNCASRLKPGRFVSSAADGFIGSGHKTGYWIENCTVEGLLDDCVNASRAHLHIESRVSTNILKLYSASILESGNHLTLFHPAEARVEGTYEVLGTVKGMDGLWTVTLDRGVETVYSGEENGNSQLFIEERAHQYAYIRNNTFRNSRRYGALFRTHDGVIEGNTYLGLGSSAIHAENESNTSFDGGFDNRNVRILNNTIQDCGQTFYFFSQNRAAIQFGINGFGAVCTQAVHQNIEITGNRIYDWNRRGIAVKNAATVLIHSNTITNLNSSEFYPGGQNYGIFLQYTDHAEVTGNDLRDSRLMNSAVQIEDSTNCTASDNLTL